MSDTTTTKRFGVRSIAALLIFIIAVLLTPVAAVGHWGHRTVVDADRYIQTVGPLASSPEVQEALTNAVTEAVLAKVDTEQAVDGLLTNLFPDSKLAESLAGPIASGVDSLISQLIAKFIASDQFQKLWVELNTLAQQGVVRLLEGKEDAVVKLEGENVVLDMSSLITEVQNYLVANGVSAAASITVPDTDKQIVLMQAPALAQLRFIYSLASPVLQWLPILVAVLFAIAIALARRRARMVVAVGIGILFGALAIQVGMGIAEGAFVDQLANTVFAPASTVFWNTLFQYLVEGLNAIIAMGIATVLFGWFGGRTKSARILRGHITRGLGEIGARLPEGLSGLGAAVARQQQAIRGIIYAIVVLLVLLTDVMSVTAIFWAAALGAGLVTALQILIGRGEEETIEIVVTEISVS